MVFLGLIILSYLIGSISTAVVVCRRLSLPDPRQVGSLNPGTSNVFRIGGIKPASFTFAGDLLKGFIPVYIVSSMGYSITHLEIITVASVTGHLWPIFTQFKGGKGIATAVGALTAITWGLPAMLVSIWLLTFFILRYVSLASIISTFCAPIASFMIFPELFNTTLVIMALLLFKHRSNFQRLLNGTETKINKLQS